MEPQERDEWGREVGKALLSFGDIELITRKCLGPNAPDQLGQRLDRLVNIIEGHRAELSLAAAEFMEKLREAKDLTEVRNTIAHDPLQLTFYNELAAEHGISDAKRPGETMDLANLKEFAAGAENWASELFVTFGKIQSEFPDLSWGR